MGKRCVVLTGAGGAIGSTLLRRMSNRSGHYIIGIFSSPASEQRCRSAMDGIDWNNVIPVHVDLRESEAGRAISEKVGSPDSLTVIHSAADVSWTKSEAALTALNVGAARQMAALTASFPGRKALIMFSTAYAHRESSQHLNAYELTKRQAESLVAQEFGGRLPIGVVRPSLVIGDSHTGAIGRFNGLYPLIRLIAFGEVPCLLGEPTYQLDLVPVDWVADDIEDMIVHLMADAVPSVPIATTTAAGTQAFTFGECVKQIQTEIGDFRTALSLPPAPPISILRRRQFDFLMRAAESWEIAGRFEHAKRVSEVMSGYLNQSEAPITLVPTRPRNYANALIAKSTRFWLEANKGRFVSPRNLHWSENVATAGNNHIV